MHSGRDTAGSLPSRLGFVTPPGSRVLWLMLIVAAAALAASFWPDALTVLLDLDKAAVIAKLRAWGMWGAAGSIALMIAHSFVPFPAEILACANGVVFGALWGTLVTWVGAMLGACLAFALARWLGRPFVERLVPAHQLDRADAWTATHGTKALLISRLVPLIAFNLINYAAGLANVGWWTFLWTTAIGILPLAAAMATFGELVLSLPGWIWVVLGLVILASSLALGRRAGSSASATDNAATSVRAGSVRPPRR